MASVTGVDHDPADLQPKRPRQAAVTGQRRLTSCAADARGRGLGRLLDMVFERGATATAVGAVVGWVVAFSSGPFVSSGRRRAGQ